MIVNWQIKQLQAKIAKLKREKALLRLFLHELVEAHYRTINQASAEPEAQEPEPKKEANHE